MKPRIVSLPVVLLSVLLASSAVAQQPIGDPGERLGPEAFGPGVVEEWEDAVLRDQAAPPRPPRGLRKPGEQGEWVVPSLRDTFYPNSGKHYVMNKWGDTRLGIGFPELVDVHGAFFAGQAAKGAWTTGVRVIGYRDGTVVRETPWFTDIDKSPTWFPMGLRGVNRIVIESQPVVNGGGWYAMDDLTYSVHTDGPVSADRMVVIDFEDVDYRTTLTGTQYAGLTWEAGQGDFSAGPVGIHAPQIPEGFEAQAPDTEGAPGGPDSGQDATGPTMGLNFVGVDLNDGNAYPPDTMGAIGTFYYVEVVNQNISVFNRDTGQRLSNTSLESFFNVSGLIGDPRVVWDQHSDRWIIIATTFDNSTARARVYFAVSRTANPLFGGWYKNYIQTDQGSDAGRWPDFPTLGYDARGIYFACFMVGNPASMTIWALDKAPLVANPPSLGTVTVWRGKPWEWAIQLVHTYGDPGVEYMLSRSSETGFRFRRIAPPLTAPLLYEMGNIGVQYNFNPPSAPALGSTTDIDTGDARPQEAVYRDGYVWTCQAVYWNGRSAIRWYQFNPTTMLLVQSGTVADASLHYYYPSIMVNSRGEVTLGFSGSNASQYVASYFTGRLPTDPAGEMAPPVLMKAGEGPYTVIAGGGRNRWGDYSSTRLDPLDETSFWCIQEYARSPSNRWGTWVGVLAFVPQEQACCLPSGLCQNETPTACTSAGGTPQGVGTTCATTSCPPCRGDLNCSGVVDFGDINPFVMALTNPAGWQSTYPGCPVLNGDINSDNLVDFGDINPFVSLLSSGGGAPKPCQ